MIIIIMIIPDDDYKNINDYMDNDYFNKHIT